MANRIDTTLGALREAGRPALAPFVTVGYPDLATSTDIVEAILAAGGDMIELGVPFSDPLADGPTIQKTSFHALQQGVNLRACLKVVRELRSRGVDAPVIMMGYLNPFMHYGTEDFVRDAAREGVDGLIIPDLPTEESEHVGRLCAEHGLHLIPLLAPTSTDRRIAQACQRAGGFIYCVSLTGVTGARSELSAELPSLVGRIRKHTQLPILVGFGVSDREHVESIAEYADGAVVASALLSAVGKVPVEDAVRVAKEFVTGLKPAAL